LQEKWLHLYSFDKDESISLKEAISASHILELFHLPVYVEAMVQLNLFQALLQDLLPATNSATNSDSWTMLESQKFINP
jgi:hypothetical protein